MNIAVRLSDMKCVVCGGELPPASKYGNPRRVCSTRCHQWRAAHGDETPRWLIERHCQHCSAAIDDPDIRLKFCSVKCRQRASRRSAIGKAARTCRYCDQPYEVTNGKQRYCSTDCRIKYNSRFGSATNLRRQATKRGAILEGRFTLLDVVARDGWVCALCICLIHPEARDHRMRATIDHIVPVAAGGNHSFENVQLAHGACNAAKRDRTDVIIMSHPNTPERVIVRGRIGSSSQES